MIDTDRFKAIATHPRAVPRRENVFGALGSAVVILAAGVLRRYGVELTPEETAAATTIAYFVVSHFTPQAKWNGRERRI